MERGSTCRRHENVEASFVCDCCGDPFCSRCRCELLGGSVCCTECAVEKAGQSGGVLESHQRSGGAGELSVGRPSRRGRFLTLVLLVCIPLLVLEGLFLHRSRETAVGAETEAHHVMSDTLVLITVINNYRLDTGAYPDVLEQLIPSHWKSGDTAELERYEYCRSGEQQFVLQPRLTGNDSEDAGIARARSLVPQVLGPHSSLDVFLNSSARALAQKQSGGTP